VTDRREEVLKRPVFPIILAALAVLTTPGAKAAMIFTATLTGAQEVPSNASPGSGFGMVLLNDAQTQITVDLSWSGLTAPATAAHIHDGAPGIVGPVLFNFTGVPGATSGAIPEQSFAITAGQVAQLQAGHFYMDVHTSNFEGGEIRGQVTLTPEPASVWLIGLGLSVVAVARCRMRWRDLSLLSVDVRRPMQRCPVQAPCRCAR
jgi:hypothetical protein